MPRRAPPITRAELEARAGPNLAREGLLKPELRPVSIRGIDAVVKDYGRRPAPIRATVGRFSVWREVTIYRILRGVPGIPRFLGRIDDHAFAVERVDGTPVSECRQGRLPDGFLPRLEALVRLMHARGVVHGDLRQRQNILVGPGGEPWLIDFASSVGFPRGFPLLTMAALTDLSGVAKLKAKHAPDTLSPGEKRLLILDRLRFVRLLRHRRRHEKRGRRREERRRRRNP